MTSFCCVPSKKQPHHTLSSTLVYMISIKREDVPYFLKNGALYSVLDSEDSESFEVPSKCFKKDACVNNVSDLETMLNATRYWGLSQLPVTVISFLLNHNSTQRNDDLLSTFPEFGNFLKRVGHVSSCPMEEVIAAAIKVDFGVATVTHLYEQNYIPLTPSAYLAAAERDDILSMKYLHEHGCQWHERTIHTAIARGSVKCLYYAYNYMRDGTLPLNCMQMAAEAGHIPVMQFLNKVGIAYPKEIYTTAPNLAVVKHLRSVGCAWVSHHCSHFAARNMLDCIIYANANGSRWSVNTTQTAALHGRTQILEHLRKHGCPWNAQVTYLAAQKGHHLCLRYALRRGCPCTWRALLCAVKERQWVCVIYLVRMRFGRLVTALVVSLFCICIAFLYCRRSIIEFLYDVYHTLCLAVRILSS